MRDSCDQFVELESSIADTVRQAQQKLRIILRVEEILRVDGSAYDYCPEKAREQATLDVIGAPAK